MGRLLGIKALENAKYKTENNIDEIIKEKQKTLTDVTQLTRNNEKILAREKRIQEDLAAEQRRAREKVLEKEKELEEEKKREKFLASSVERRNKRIMETEHNLRNLKLEQEKEFNLLRELLLESRKINYSDYTNIINDGEMKKALNDEKFVDTFRNYIIKIDTKYENMSDQDFSLYLRNRLHFQNSKSILADNLNYYTKLRGKTPSDVAKHFKISSSTVSDWYNGINFPRPDKIQLLADYLNIPAVCLTEDRNKYMHGSVDLNTTIAPTTTTCTKKVPVLGNIPAGIPNEAIEYIEDWEEISATWVKSDKEYFALKIKGNSMYPDFKEGDVVIFQRASRCDNGKNCAVMIENNDVTFKKLLQTEAGLILQPINDKEFDPIFYNKKQVIEKNIRVIGIPKEIRRKLD